MMEKTHEVTGNVNTLFKTQSGPTVPEKCPECYSKLHVSYTAYAVGIVLKVAGLIARWADVVRTYP